MKDTKEYVVNELDLAGVTGRVREAVLTMWDTFEQQGHSGFSAAATLRILELVKEAGPEVLYDMEVNVGKEDNGLGASVVRAAQTIFESVEPLSLSEEELSEALKIFTRVARFQPLTPLTGEDDEWIPLSDSTFQNKRAFNVFKTSDGKAYQSDYYIFVTPEGAAYTSVDSRKYIEEFPYMPQHEFVRVEN